MIDKPDTEPTAIGVEPNANSGAGKSEPSADVQNQLANLQEQLLRSLAEQQTIRRLAKRDRDVAVKFSISDLAKDVLDTVDNLQSALDSAGNSEDPDLYAWRPASRLRSAMLATVSKYGVQQFDRSGQSFDPHRDEALFEHPGGQKGQSPR